MRAFLNAILEFVRREPVVVGNLVKAVLMLLVAFGLPVDMDLVEKIIAIIAVGAGVTYAERQSVWPDSKVQTLFKKD